MKKIVTVILIMLVMGIVNYLIIPKNNIEYTVEFIDYNEEEELSYYICVKNSTGKYELVNICVSMDELTNSSIYYYLLNLSNEKRNSIPLNYSFGTYSNYTIDNIELKDKLIIIEVSSYYGNIEQLKTFIYWTYSLLGFEEFEINVNDKQYIIKEEIPINLESYAWYNDSKLQTIFYYNENSIYPVSYYHKDTREDFILNKIINGVCEYRYQISEDYIYLYLTDKDNKLNINKIGEIKYNLKNYYKNVVIIKNGNVLT